MSAPRQLRILLVDDAEPIRAIQKKVLSALGSVDFIEAADGMDALRLFKSASPAVDLVLIDYDVPQSDGTTLARRLRQIDRTTPIVMCTAQSGRQHVLDAIRLGVNNYLVKPFTPEALLERVQQTLARASSPAQPPAAEATAA